MIALIWAFMVYYDNFSQSMWLYMALHGSYGCFWVLADLTFPNPGFARKVTFLSAALPTFVIIPPYYYGVYLIASRQAPQEVSPERLCVCIMMYVFGIVLMMGTDGQKYFTLREKKKLLNDGWVKYSRNTNYVGEMLLYASFALVT